MKGAITALFSLMILSGAVINGTAAAEEIIVTGDMEVSGGVSLTQAGSVIKYPDGSVQEGAPAIFSRTLIIIPRGTAAENGITLIETILGINDADSSKRYLIHLEPGTYDLGTESLIMKSYVSIEGSGEGATLIRGRPDAPNAGVVIGASYCELRDLSIHHTGGGAFALGIYNDNVSPSLTNLTVKAENGQQTYAIYNKNSAPSIDRVTCEASGTVDIACGIYVSGGNPTYIKNLSAKAAGGHNNYGVWNAAGSSTVLRNITAEASGGTDCYGIFNQNCNCDMAFITASASNGENLNAGVFNTYSLVSMVGLTANSSGGVHKNYGVYNSHSSVPVMNGVKASAKGASEAHGIYNKMSELSLTNVNAEASAATTKSCGMTNAPDSGTSSYVLSVDRSTFKGSNHSISSSGNYTLKIGLSKLDGAASGGGTWQCVGCFNGSYAALGPDCQVLP